jgi:hypothetical protein
VLPFHFLVFGNLAKNIVARARQQQAQIPTPPKEEASP